MNARWSLLLAVGLLANCAASVAPGSEDDGESLEPQCGPPPGLVGEFEDDYGIPYTIGPDLWFQHPNARYHVLRWNLEGQYLIARNDEGNPSEGGLFTRIDWMGLDDGGGYRFAFCMSAFEARSAEEAEASTVARRETPKTGCNGFPFSRLRALAAVDSRSR